MIQRIVIFPYQEGWIWLARAKHAGNGHVGGWSGEFRNEDGNLENAARRILLDQAEVTEEEYILERMSEISFFKDNECVAKETFYICTGPSWVGKLKATSHMYEGEHHNTWALPLEQMREMDMHILPHLIRRERIRWHCYYKNGDGQIDRVVPVGPLV